MREFWILIMQTVNFSRKSFHYRMCCYSSLWDCLGPTNDGCRYLWSVIVGTLVFVSLSVLTFSFLTASIIMWIGIIDPDQNIMDALNISINVLRETLFFGYHLPKSPSPILWFDYIMAALLIVLTGAHIVLILVWLGIVIICVGCVSYVFAQYFKGKYLWMVSPVKEELPQEQISSTKKITPFSNFITKRYHSIKERFCFDIEFVD